MRVAADLIRVLGGGSSVSKAAKLEEGDKVEANYRGRGKWYPGKITKDRRDGTYDISYDDGESEARVPEDMIRSLPEINGLHGQKKSPDLINTSPASSLAAANRLPHISSNQTSAVLQQSPLAASPSHLPIITASLNTSPAPIAATHSGGRDLIQAWAIISVEANYADKSSFQFLANNGATEPSDIEMLTPEELEIVSKGLLLLKRRKFIQVMQLGINP